MSDANPQIQQLLSVCSLEVCEYTTYVGDRLGCGVRYPLNYGIRFDKISLVHSNEICLSMNTDVAYNHIYFPAMRSKFSFPR